MHILLTGANGQVGWELQRCLQPLGRITALDRRSLDLGNPDQICSVLRELKPSVIVNPAAYTAVDKAENEADLAMAINGTAPGILAEETKRLDALLVHFSTDYVFDGHKPDPYHENDPTEPLGSYGRSKLVGEEAIRACRCRHLIFRTSWVYGLRGHNFLRTILRLAKEHDELRIVGDQFGAPTWSRMVAETTALALAKHTSQQGIYHMTASSSTSWYGFAEAILHAAALRGMLDKIPTVHRITTAEFPTTATRPINSRLDCSRLSADFGLNPPDWLTQLELSLG